MILYDKNKICNIFHNLVEGNVKSMAQFFGKDYRQFPATYYHPKVIVEVGACNSTTRSFRLPFSLLPQTWATIGSMT